MKGVKINIKSQTTNYLSWHECAYMVSYECRI